MINLKKQLQARLKRATINEERWYTRYYRLRDFKSDGGCHHWPLARIMIYDEKIIRASRRLQDSVINQRLIRQEVINCD